MQFPVYTNDGIPTKHYITLRKSMNMRASELGNFLHFHILKLLFPSIFCWYFWYFISETYIFQVSNYNLHDLQCSSLFLLMVWRYYTNDSIPTKHWHWRRKNMRASLGHFSHFYILKMLFLSIFLLVLQILCWYKWHACRQSAYIMCTDKTPKKHGGLR